MLPRILPIFLLPVVVAADTITCTYPLSGAYTLLPRVFFYLTLFLALCVRNEWLVAASLLSIMTYTGTGAIHALILSHRSPLVLDLDSRILLVLLSAALLAFAPILQWSGTLRSQSARRIYQLWGVLVSVGVVCCIAGFVGPRVQAEVGCRDAHGRLLTRPQETGWDCSYTCFSGTSPVRGSSDVVAMPTAMLEGMRLPLQFAMAAALACIVCVPLYTISVSTQRGDDEERRISKSFGNDVHEQSRSRWVPGMFSMVCFCALVVLVVLCEKIVVKELPRQEEVYAVGQWGGFVAAALVAAATGINWWIERSSGVMVRARLVRSEKA